MAVTFKGSTWTTTAGNKTVTATPAVNDLIVVVCANSARSTAQPPTITDNNSSGTYTQIKSATKNTSADSMWFFVRTALIGAASSTIFTSTQASDTGGGLAVFSVTGVKNVGASADLASGSQDNTAAATPSITLSATPSALNPLIGAVNTTSNSSANTAEPSGWTEDSDQGYTSTANGLETVHIASGHSSSTVAWTATTATNFASIAVEFAADPLPTAATGTGAASNAAISLQPNAGNAAGTGTSSQLSTSIAPAQGVASGTGVVATAAVSLQPNAGNPAGSGSALAAAVAVSNEAAAGNAAGTGLAYDPVIGTASNSVMAYARTAMGIGHI